MNQAKEILEAIDRAGEKCLVSARAATDRGNDAHAREDMHAYKVLMSLEGDVRAILRDDSMRPPVESCKRCGRGAPACPHGLCADCNVIDPCREPSPGSSGSGALYVEGSEKVLTKDEPMRPTEPTNKEETK